MAHRVSMAHGTEIGVASRTGYAARWSSVTPDLTGDGAAFASCARGSDERASRKLNRYNVHVSYTCDEFMYDGLDRIASFVYVRSAANAQHGAPTANMQ